MENEIWKDIKGYDGLYEVSDQGRVRSLSRNTTKGKIIVQYKGGIGYLRVTLSKNNLHKTHLVHRLVAQAFVYNDDPEHKTQCNHINEDKTDNRACNLEWMTPKDNCNYGTRNKNVQKNKSKPVVQKNIDGKIIKIWPSIMEAEKNGYFSAGIIGCCKGKYKQHKGYIWVYA